VALHTHWGFADLHEVPIEELLEYAHEIESLKEKT
jgi:hypothetical protein